MNLTDYREIELKIVQLKEISHTLKKAPSPIKYEFNTRSFKSKIKNPFGNLYVIIDELLRNGVSYFLKERVGLFKSKVTPILFNDEKPEFLLNVSTGRFRKLPLFFTGRRFLIAFNGFIQSKWIKPTFQNLFSLLKKNYWKEGILKEARYDGVSMNIKLRQGLPLKYVEIGWIKHIYKNGWAEKVHHPVGYTLYERKAKTGDFLSIILERVQKAIETDVLDLIALEDFCLTKDLEIHKVGVNEFGASKLESGRLNLGKKKA